MEGYTPLPAHAFEPAGLTTGPQTTGPQTTGPQTTGPQTTGPQTTGPQMTGPQMTCRHPLTLVALHGFTQTGASWGPLATRLGGSYRLLAPDAPGHGRASALRAGLWETADLLDGTVVADGGSVAGWVGYSMGGRMALHVALAHPRAVPKLALISTSPGIEDDIEREARHAADEALAKRIEEGGPQGLGRFLADWLAQPLFATLPRERAGLDARLSNSPAGLASSLRLAGAGAQEPLWGRLPELGRRKLPVLLLAGELDRKYCELASATAEAIGPTATVRIVSGAGHACHLERPDEVAGELARFFDAGD